MRRLRLVPVIAAYVTCASAIAQTQTKPWASEPDSYRGVKFGTSLEAAQKEVSLTGCLSAETLKQRVATRGKRSWLDERGQKDMAEIDKRLDESSARTIAGLPPGGTICTTPNQIAGVRTNEQWIFGEGGLAMVFFSFGFNEYPALREVFLEKFGKPHSAKTENIQTRPGVNVENENLDWDGSHAHVSLQRYSGTVTYAEARFFTHSSFEWWTKQQEEKKAKAKDAF